jgi:hypothetical protein
MRRMWSIMAIIVLVLVGCNSGQTQDPGTTDQTGTVTPTTQSSTTGQTVTPTQGTEQTAQGNTSGSGQDQEAYEGIRGGYFESTRFNIRFQWPADWRLISTITDDSVSIEGPDGLQMVVANSQSFQLVNTSFENLNDRVSFDQVNLVPERAESRPINGLPGYRVEGDALLRGQNVPVYFISQALSLPGEPVVATVFIPGEFYFQHSDVMKAVLDSFEALNIRPQ